jgi:hypothetical protein
MNMKMRNRWVFKIDLITFMCFVLLGVMGFVAVATYSNATAIIAPSQGISDTAQGFTQVETLPTKMSKTNEGQTAEVLGQAEQNQQDLVKSARSDFNNAVETQVAQKQTTIVREQDERMNNGQQWLENERKRIEKKYTDAKQRIPEQRRDIEERYQVAVGKLQRWRTSVLEALNAADRGAAARFIQNQNETVSFNDSTAVTNGHISPGGYLNATTYSSGTSNNFVLGNPAGLFELEITGNANSRVEVADIFEKISKDLKNQKAEYLESITMSEKSLLNEKTRALQEAERIAADRLAGGPGVAIDAIGSSGKRSYFMVGENIYYQGDTINGFKIQKILADEIIFEKDGKTFNRPCR